MGNSNGSANKTTKPRIDGSYRKTTPYRNPKMCLSARGQSTAVGSTSTLTDLKLPPNLKKGQHRRSKTAHDKQRNSVDSKMMNLSVDDQSTSTRKSSGHLSQCSNTSVSTRSSADPVIMKEFVLTQLQIRQLQRIWSTVRAKGATYAAEAVFTSVFSRTPGARNTVSPSGDSAQITQRLFIPWTALMDTIIARLNRPDVIARQLEQLGGRHAVYRERGFHPSWLTMFAECMTQQALQWGTKQQRNSGTQEAWTKLVMFIVHHMRDGYYAQVKADHSSTSLMPPKSRVRCLSDNAARSSAQMKAQFSVGCTGSDDDDTVVQKTRRTRSTDDASPTTSTVSTYSFHNKTRRTYVSPLTVDVEPSTDTTTSTRSPRLVKFTTGESTEVTDVVDIEPEGSTIYEDSHSGT